VDEESIFAAALGKPSPVERRAFLAEACSGDPELRARVEALLHAHDDPDSFLEPRNVAFVPPVDLPPIREHSGTLIGPYKLLEQIGEGGFGVVYLAEQQQPVRRKVALKVIKPGMDSKQVIARFEAERQALAMMEHTNIARVLDAGTTDSGRPYFVMELVRGIPITQCCDDNRLTPRERLELFIAVCQAVQHAHQKGIIHRDLKPSNVLVTLHDGTPLVKVIDFGIAKALGQGRLTEETLCTGFAQMIGTPLYMSPEQAEMSAIDVDTRTDIYALGVLLYELLTGTTPFDKERLKGASYEELRRILREEEPAKPSTRISTLGQAANTVSANRKTEPKRLSQLIRGELDWIVMKALEKDRNRRYETASSFAADVQRYLHDEPVQACPPSAGYRFRKFARRNRAALMTAAMIAFTVLMAVAVSSGLIWRANRELRQTSYYQSIALAEREWSANNMSRVEELLDGCPTGLRGWEWHYLRRLGRGGVLTLHHDSAALCVAFSPDGRFLASGSQNGTVKIWDTRDWHQIHSIFAHANHRVRCVDFSPDSQRLITAGWDGKARVWDLRSGHMLLEVSGNAKRTNRAVFSPDGRWVALAVGTEKPGEDNGIQVRDAGTGQICHTLEGHKNYIWGLTFSLDGRLASAGWDQAVKVWDVATGRELFSRSGLGEALYCVVFSRNGQKLAAAGGRPLWSGHPGHIWVWDSATGKELLHLRGHTNAAHNLAFSPDGGRLASVDGDMTVKLWDTATGKEALTLHGHYDIVWSVAFSPDGYRLASASGDGTVRVWDATPPDASPGEELLTLRGHTEGVHDVAFSPDGERLVSASQDRTVRIWDATTGKELLLLKEFPESVRGVAFSSDSQRLAAISEGDTLFVWEPPARNEPLRFPQAGNCCVAFSPDSRGIATAGINNDFAVKVWDLSTRRQCLNLAGHSFFAKKLAFSPDGRRLASASWDQTVKVWDVSHGQELRSLGVFGSLPPILGGLVWMHTTLAPAVQTLRGHASSVWAVAFSPDGKSLASGGNDHAVQVWNTKTWQLMRTLRDRTGGVLSVVFSPDGQRLATGGSDATVKVWNASTGQLLRTLHGHSNWVTAVVFSPDGRRLVSASLDGTIKLWRVPPLMVDSRQIPSEPGG
jgi:WD40 repeat protein/serine/threonine protein kinase